MKFSIYYKRHGIKEPSSNVATITADSQEDALAQFSATINPHGWFCAVAIFNA